MKLKNAYQKSKYKGKKMDQTVNTIPDQNLSIRQLLDRHSRGLPLGASQNQGEYFDTEIPRFYDLTDMLKYKQELMDRNKSINNLIKDEKKAAKQREKENLKKTEDLQTSDKNETLVN